MRRIPATPGQLGCNVRGESIEPQPGCDRAFSDQLIGAYVDKDDANLLRAVFSGQPVCSANGVNIEHVLHLRNVNMATGNIAFDGTVQIDGEVLPGMKVNATGDIIVGDVVDGAILTRGRHSSRWWRHCQGQRTCGGVGDSALCRECPRLCGKHAGSGGFGTAG